MSQGFEVDLGPFRSQMSQIIAKARSAAVDLTPAWKSILSSWFKGNRSIFALKGPGRYKDLARSTKRFKERILGTPYPILKLTGTLADSITIPGAQYSIASTSPLGVVMGSSVPYGIYHQSPEPRKKIPFRPFILLGVEQVAPQELNVRVQTWVTILESYLSQKLGAL